MEQEQRPFVPHRPEKFASVQVPSFLCPFNDEDLERFCELVSALPQLHSRNMTDRRALWVSALAIARTLSDITDM
jgi:hypothetical protein